jgi:hypothetical protein
LDPDFAVALTRVRLAVWEARRADLDGRERREWVFLAMVVPLKNECSAQSTPGM